jgi:hypothetical protein
MDDVADEKAQHAAVYSEKADVADYKQDAIEAENAEHNMVSNGLSELVQRLLTILVLDRRCCRPSASIPWPLSGHSLCLAAL